MTTFCDKAIQLFTYLKELSKLRMKSVRDVTGYDEILWFSDVPHEKECRCIAWDLWDQKGDEQGDLWLEVRKPDRKSAPEMPDDLEPWIDEQQVSDSTLDQPDARDEIVIRSEPDPDTGEQETEILMLNDHPEIFALWIKYVDEKWKPWAEEDRRCQTIQKVYNDLYTTYQRAEKFGEQYEVVVGLGFLQWKSPKSGTIRHPSLTIQSRIEFDPQRGILSVRPALNGPEPKLEIDMLLETDDRPVVPQEQAIQKLVDELDGEPWNGPELDAILKSLANGISTESRYDRSLSRSGQVSDVPRIVFAPSLILRKRTQRTFVDFYSKIVDQLEADGDVPEGVRRFIGIVEDEEPVDELHSAEPSPSTAVVDTELYFPLPANEEQKKIADLIEHHKGILVTGPPGTGKSHTIVNLISHFLAKGQRVLVTSEMPRALEVLRDMLPEEIRELCVTWLGSGPVAQNSLEKSVGGITRKQQDWNPEDADDVIANLTQQLDQARRHQARLWGEITACREADTYQHANQFGSYSGTLQTIAKQINKERESYGWFLDRPDPEDDPLVTSAELLRLCRLDRQLTDDQLREVKMRPLPTDCLIPPVEFGHLVEAEDSDLTLHEKAETKRHYPGYDSLKDLRADKRARMLELLNQLIHSMDELSKHPDEWPGRAAREIAAGQDRVWRQQLEVTQTHIRKFDSRSREISALRITGLEDRDHAEISRHVRELKDHLDKGGWLGLFGPLRPQPVRQASYLIDRVRVEGESCRSRAALQKLLDGLDFERRLDELDDLWRPCTASPKGNFAARLAAYADLCEPLRQAVAIHETVEGLKGFVSGLAELASPRWHVRDDVESLRDAVQAVDVDERLKKTRNVFDGLKRTVADFLEQAEASPAARPILNALNTRDTKAYKNAYADVVRINELAQEYAIRCGIFETFKTSSPATAERYETTACDESWDDRFENFGVAWNWATTDRWLADLSREDRAKQLADDMKRSQSDERRILKKLAVQKAWQHCMHNLGERERQALIAWEQAVRKIGRGTGRHAPRHRETARRKLAECRKAIPAWIMPLYQVVQTTEPQKRFFDVVIVDEASQSGPEAILLNYIGKKIIVIGDDKQIAPERVGTSPDGVTRLRQMHLDGISHSESFDLDSSFFSAAKLRFKAQLQLREHFRCMPEIIQFSNKLSYGTQPLIPLRQFGAGRLEPCKTTLVNEGYRTKGSSIIENKPEAQELVAQVVNCLEDPTYDGKTFGVICLLGHAQAKLITNLLMQHVGAEEMERRKLMCGSPGDFQGSERDVIFLSMVDAPPDGKTCQKVSTAKDQRRFNVAASRAKDQLWLFHTPTLNDLKTECLRYRLLEHCLNPSVQPTTVGDHDLAELRHLAKTARRTDDNHPKPFDSWFEVDVCLKIADRGYRVLPQYEVAGRRIDLVVQGLEGQLAVECDGDRWHGPERFHKDTERQRQLERCKWRFWRVRGSQFYRDPDAALQSLWEQLTGRGILPECQWSDQRRKNEEGKRSGTKSDAAVEETTVRPHSDFRAVAVPGHPEVAPEDGPQNEEETSEQIHPDQSTAHDNERSNQRPENLPPGKIQRAIVEALEECPHGTCTVKSITSRVLKQLGMRTRGNPRAEFERRVKRNVGVLKRKELIEEYKAKNRRLRLLPGAKQHTLL